MILMEIDLNLSIYHISHVTFQIQNPFKSELAWSSWPSARCSVMSLWLLILRYSIHLGRTSWKSGAPATHLGLRTFRANSCCPVLALEITTNFIQHNGECQWICIYWFTNSGVLCVSCLWKTFFWTGVGWGGSAESKQHNTCAISKLGVDKQNKKQAACTWNISELIKIMTSKTIRWLPF